MYSTIKRVRLFSVFILGFLLISSCIKEQENFSPDPLHADLDSFLKSLYTSSYNINTTASITELKDNVYLNVSENSLLYLNGDTYEEPEFKVTFVNNLQGIISNKRNIQDSNLKSLNPVLLMSLSDLEGNPIGVSRQNRISLNIPDFQKTSGLELFEQDKNGLWVPVLDDQYIISNESWLGADGQLLTGISLEYSNDNEVLLARSFSDGFDHFDICVDFPAGFTSTNTVCYIVSEEGNYAIELMRNADNFKYCNNVWLPKSQKFDLFSITLFDEKIIYFQNIENVIFEAETNIQVQPQQIEKESIEDFLKNI